MNNEKQVQAPHYRFDSYVSKGRWNSFYHQVSEITAFRPESVLEVGAGTGILGAVLRQLGHSYESVDIAEDLNPDHVGSVTDLPFADDAYDVIGCFEVLEHIEFHHVDTAIHELCRVARRGCVISLPDAKRVWPNSIYIPGIGRKAWLIPRPFERARQHDFNGEHYWEINKMGFPLGMIEETIRSAAAQRGFMLQNTYRVQELPYHRFFVLEFGGASEPVSRSL